MASLRSIASLLVLLIASGAGGTLAAPAGAGAATRTHSLYASRNLWATVNVCSPSDKPNTVGIRGSMPSDGRSGDTMYMRFRVQYIDPSTKRWTDLPQGATPGFVTVPAAAASQAGDSFQLVPTSSAFTLRGVVDFQWRHGARVVHATSRITTAAHRTVEGADPAGYSAATCVLS